MDLSKLHSLCEKNYRQQAVWFLNCFWEQLSAEAEELWSFVHLCNELDLEKHADGNGLDEMKAHVFLERKQDTHTVRELRERLRSTGAIGESERPKLVPLAHYLLFRYNVNWHTLVDESRQGSNKEELEKAERLLAEVQSAFQESERKASEARIAHNQAQAADRAAKASHEEAIAREASAKASFQEAKVKEEKAIADAKASKEKEAESIVAQQELESALAEVQAQEHAYNEKKADLERKSEEGGIVSRNKAKAELAQHLAEDPLPLRRAKITAEAALKKAERATEAAVAARHSAEQSAAASSKAREAADRDAKAASEARVIAERDAHAAAKAAADAAAASAAADDAVDAALERLREAEVYLTEVKSKPGQAFGALWWIDRELYEQRKFIPVSKGGIAK